MPRGATPPDPGPQSGPGDWRPDHLLSGFECLDLPLAVGPLEGEPDDPLVGTLVRRADAALRTTRRAVLHVHGWNDYFFHPHVAEFYESLGFAFYALDLRRYGRSYREGQFRGYVTDLADYAEEIDAAVAMLRGEHGPLVLAGHSTGGLTTSVWAADHPGALAGLVLNSPWLDMWGPPALNAVLRPLLVQWARRSPTSPLPLPESDEQVYARAMHTSHGGEWDYSLDLKAPSGEQIRLGWLQAIVQGHARVARGLGIDCPVLVTTSDRTVWLRRYGPAAREADTVLDVDRINAVAWRLGRHVTTVRIAGGTHDLSLSQLPARLTWFAALSTWLSAYVPAGAPVPAEAR